MKPEQIANCIFECGLSPHSDINKKWIIDEIIRCIKESNKAKWIPAIQTPYCNEESGCSEIVLIRVNHSNMSNHITVGYYRYGEWYWFENNKPMSSEYHVKEWQKMPD